MESCISVKEMRLSLLFNFQGALRLSGLPRQLIYYTIPLSLCQEVFQSFFKIFSTACFQLGVSLEATFILYQTVSRLSRGFSNFFEVFRFPCGSRYLSRTADILYYNSSVLSRGILKFFEEICNLDAFIRRGGEEPSPTPHADGTTKVRTQFAVCPSLPL